VSRTGVARATLLATVLLAAVPAALAPAALAQPSRPPLPRSKQENFDPDPLVCKPQAIESAFRQHLQPWADQPEEVQARLRLLQAEMTRRSLARCLTLGLLTAAEVRQLEQRLGLGDPPAQSPSSGTRP
jgi:hypothetical protein